MWPSTVLIFVTPRFGHVNVTFRLGASTRGKTPVARVRHASRFTERAAGRSK
jgi:hypothetical protein